MATTAKVIIPTNEELDSDSYSVVCEGLRIMGEADSLWQSAWESTIQATKSIVLAGQAAKTARLEYYAEYLGTAEGNLDGLSASEIDVLVRAFILRK